MTTAPGVLGVDDHILTVDANVVCPCWVYPLIVSSTCDRECCQAEVILKSSASFTPVVDHLAEDKTVQYLILQWTCLLTSLMRIGQSEDTSYSNSSTLLIVGTGRSTQCVTKMLIRSYSRA